MHRAPRCPLLLLVLVTAAGATSLRHRCTERSESQSEEHIFLRVSAAKGERVLGGLVTRSLKDHDHHSTVPAGASGELASQVSRRNIHGICLIGRNTYVGTSEPVTEGQSTDCVDSKRTD